MPGCGLWVAGVTNLVRHAEKRLETPGRVWGSRGRLDASLASVLRAHIFNRWISTPAHLEPLDLRSRISNAAVPLPS
eukprot:8119292-Pyramimonas_sp.AAC.3